VMDRVTFIHGSILDEGHLKNALGGCDTVFHQAAIASVPRSVLEPVPYYEVNGMGTLRVLEAARQSGGTVKRVVYAASSSAYGDTDVLPKVETMSPLPLSPYASAKFAGEHLLRTYCHCYGLTGISLRYFNIFGPRQRPDSPYAAVIPRFAEALKAGRNPLIYGDGTQTRDFTDVQNAVQANLLAGDLSKPLHGQVVNIACGQRFSLLELVEAIGSEMGVKPAIDFAPPRVGEVKHSQASIEQARQLLGYEPQVSFREGLRRTIQALA